MADFPLPESLIHSLTVREQRLVQDAAVMGYVRGKMSGRDEPVPKNGVILGEMVDVCLTHRDAILREVVGACQSFPDLYAVLTGVRPCGECDHPEYNHRDCDESGALGTCLQCEADGSEDDAHHDYRLRS